MLHIRTQSQLDDMLTKALSAHEFHNLLSKMNVLNVHSALSLEGECKESKSRSVAVSKCYTVSRVSSIRHVALYYCI